MQKNDRKEKRKVDVYFCWDKDESGRDKLTNIAFLDNGVGASHSRH